MRSATMVLACVGALGMASGCNAVFGLDDVSFGAGGAGSGEVSSASSGNSSGDGTTTSVASSSSTGGGAGGDGAGGDGAGGTGTGGSCEPTVADLAVVGDFGPGWEGFWSTDNLSATEEQQGDQPLVHVIIDNAAVDGSFSNSLDGDEVCADSCARARFSLYVNAAFFLNVVVEDDENGDSLRMVLLSESRPVTGSFDIVETARCRFDPATVSPDRLAFIVPPGGGDFLLDDVELLVDACPTEDTASCSIL